jgi:hypothetical protein
MAHRIAPVAEADLAGIWDYIANKSGNADVADRLIDSLTDRFPFSKPSIYRSSPRSGFAKRLAGYAKEHIAGNPDYDGLNFSLDKLLSDPRR